MTTAAEPKPAEPPFPGGREGATVKLHPLLSAVTTGPDAWMHGETGRLAAVHALGIGVPKSQFIEIPIQSFLVEHPGAGPILIDTGFHPSIAVDPKQNLGRVGARVFPVKEMQPENAVSAQLRARGIEHADVHLVVMTHLHIDHASAIAEFPEATFVVSRREWAAAIGPRGWRHGYRQRQFDHAFDYRLVDFEAPEVDSFVPFGRAYDLLGDGSIRIVSTPGHTLGHMSVILRLRERNVLVAGDAIYTRRTLEEGVFPYTTEDEHLFGRSLREIQLYAQSNPDALVIPGHDMGFWKGLEAVYE